MPVESSSFSRGFTFFSHLLASFFLKFCPRESGIPMESLKRNQWLYAQWRERVSSFPPSQEGKEGEMEIRLPLPLQTHLEEHSVGLGVYERVSLLGWSWRQEGGGKACLYCALCGRRKGLKEKKRKREEEESADHVVCIDAEREHKMDCPWRKKGTGAGFLCGWEQMMDALSSHNEEEEEEEEKKEHEVCSPSPFPTLSTFPPLFCSPPTSCTRRSSRS